MFYEVQGVEFVNKGAELMLYAMVQHLQEKDPQAIVAANLERRYRNQERRRKVGLQYVTWVDNRLPNSGVIVNGLASLLPSPILMLLASPIRISGVLTMLKEWRIKSLD